MHNPSNNECPRNTDPRNESCWCVEPHRDTRCTVCAGVGRLEPPPPTSGFGRGPMESWPICETCNGTGNPVNPTRSDEGTGKSGLRSPQYTEAQLREYQRCFGGHAREALQNLVAEQSRLGTL